MEQQIRIEVKGKDEFWGRAFHVEWESQFPERGLVSDGAGHYIVDLAWLPDLERVGCQTFCYVTRAPDNPKRRQWFNSMLPIDRGTKPDQRPDD